MTGDTAAMVPLGTLFDIGAGKSVTPTARHGEPRYPFLRTSNVFWGRVDVTDVDTMHFTPEEFEAKTLKKGDLLVCEGGDIGRAAIWNGAIEPCSFQNHLHRLRPKDSEVVPHFYMYYLQAGFTQLGLYEGAANKTTIPNLSRNRLAALPVPPPVKTEHARAAALLHRTQTLLEMEAKLVYAMRGLKSATIRKLFSQGLRNEAMKESDVGEVPKSWSVDRFNTFVTLQRGFDLPVDSRRDGDVPVIGSNGIVGYHNVAAQQGPGVITGRSGTIGLSTYIKSAYWPLNTSLFVSDFHGNHPQFAHYFLQSFNFDRIRTGVSVPTLNRNYVHQTLIAFPQRDEQIEIAAALNIIDKKIDWHERRRSALSRLFDALLNKIMTGNVRTHDLDVDISQVAFC